MRAQTVEDELRAMRAEIAELRGEVKSLREELHHNATATPVETAAAAPLPQAQAAPAAVAQAVAVSPEVIENQAANLSMVQSQVAELAQTKVESNSKMSVKIFGTILSDTFYNSGDTNWADNPSTALAPGTPDNDGFLSSSLRQSRIGLTVEGPTIGSMKTSAVVAVDFYGGTTVYQTSSVFGLPRLLYGYVRLDGTRTAFEAGQDAMIFASKSPTSIASLAFPELYEAGSLYLQTPQLRLERQVIQSQSGSLSMALGLVAPVSTYPTPSTSYTGGYEPWLKPALQGRLAWKSSESSLGEGKGWEVGVSGHYGREQFEDETEASWGNAVDFDAHVGRFGFGAEGFRGQNLETMGGSVGAPGKAIGGFFEGRFKATSRLHFNAGMGTDQVLQRYDLLGTVHKNTGLFGNAIFRFTPELSTSVEYRPLDTSLFSRQVMHNNHFDLVVAYSF